MTRAASILVLDTNVVLDWLVFRDPSSMPLAEALAGQRAEWLACAAMRTELEHVLTRAELDRWQPDAPAVLAQWDRWARLVDCPPAAPGGLRCSDPDDQVFLDLAFAGEAQALLTRDRALLRLAHAAGRRGLAVLTPEAWARSAAGQRL